MRKFFWKSIVLSLLSLQTKVFLTLVFAILILLPAIVLCNPWTSLSFAPREMFFCDESVVPCPQMMVLWLPFAVFSSPHSIVDSFQSPLFCFPPRRIVFSPFCPILFFLPTMIVAFAPEIWFSFPQMRSEFSQLLLLVFASSVLVAENFPSRWMTPCWLLRGMAEVSPWIPWLEKMIFSILCTVWERSGLMIVSLIESLASVRLERLSVRAQSDRIFVFVEIFMSMWWMR